jgi:hypothetical protein
MTEPKPDKDEQRQALPSRIWHYLDSARNRGERHADEYADGLHDDLSDDNERLRADLARADAACIEARAGSHRLRETLKKFAAASLEYDYTVDTDCGRDYDTDAEEQAAALANIAEMHRLLGVRVQRLDAAYDENDRLRVELATAREEMAALNGKLGERGGTIFELSQENARLRTAQPASVTELTGRLAAAEAKLAVYEAIPDLCTCKARRGVVHVRGARAAAACEHAGDSSAAGQRVRHVLSSFGVDDDPDVIPGYGDMVRDIVTTVAEAGDSTADETRSMRAPSCCGTTSDCTETQCFCEPDTCGHIGETPGGAA